MNDNTTPINFLTDADIDPYAEISLKELLIKLFNYIVIKLENL